MDNLAIAWRPQEETPPDEAPRKDAHEVVKGTGVNFLGMSGVFVNPVRQRESGLA